MAHWSEFGDIERPWRKHENMRDPWSGQSELELKGEAGGCGIILTHPKEKKGQRMEFVPKIQKLSFPFSGPK